MAVTRGWNMHAKPIVVVVVKRVLVSSCSLALGFWRGRYLTMDIPTFAWQQGSADKAKGQAWPSQPAMQARDEMGGGGRH